MSNVHIHISEDEQAGLDRVVDAWERAERGEAVELETHITFARWEDFAATITPKRLELLRHVHRAPAATIADLARALGRDYKRVREDVEALVSAGLIERTAEGVRADYEEIRTAIAL